jgi:hypothetical protein
MRIKPLEELTIGQRLILIMVIALVILLAMAFVGWISGGWEAQGQQNEQLYGDAPLDAVLIRLDKRALDEAYHQRLIRLWEVWLSPTTRDASSFAGGLKLARQRYGEAATAISRRERQILEQERQHQLDQMK